MDTLNLIIKIPIEEQSFFLSILQSDFEADIEIKRLSTLRSAEVTYADILLTLVSAGSLTAIASIIKTYLARTRGRIEIICEKNSMKTVLEGPLDKLPLKQLQNLIGISELSNEVNNDDSSLERTKSLPHNQQVLSVDCSQNEKDESNTLPTIGYQKPKNKSKN